LIASKRKAHSLKPRTIGVPEIPIATHLTSSLLTPSSESESSPVYVIKCADYSAKYGMGYLLSNGHIGVFFNDKTKMLMSPKGTRLMYISFDEEGDESTKKYNTNKVPAALEKKFRLLNNFRGYLVKDNENDDLFNKPSFDNTVYVKNWIRSKNAFAFKVIFIHNFYNYKQI
jgi:polo-like kinase 1